ncbi:MAG: adenine phosphoribosyltransferase [Cyanobacteriota bacterium]|nr:adenine phosphoribosyltransferase [Cyanobacteriota bacterium]
MERQPLDLKTRIGRIPDFPKPGIVFRDITPLLGDPVSLRVTVEQLADSYADVTLDAVVGIESRGFILGASLAYHLGVGFIPVRKPGKLPPPVFSQRYSLEYGTDQLELRTDSLAPGQQVIIVDDLMATGGTAAATALLVEQAGAHLRGFGFVIELSFLQGRQQLPAGIPITSLIDYATPDE